MFSSETANASEYANTLTISDQLDIILIAIIVISSVLILLNILVIILLFKICRNTKYTCPLPDKFDYNGQFPNAPIFQQQQYGQPYQQQQANQQGNCH